MTFESQPALRALDREMWFANRLGAQGLFSLGVTTTEQRRRLIAAEILRRGIAEEVVGHVAGSNQTWRLAFERAFSTTLEEASAG